MKQRIEKRVEGEEPANSLCFFRIFSLLKGMKQGGSMHVFPLWHHRGSFPQLQLSPQSLRGRRSQRIHFPLEKQVAYPCRFLFQGERKQQWIFSSRDLLVRRHTMWGWKLHFFHVTCIPESCYLPYWVTETGPQRPHQKEPIEKERATVPPRHMAWVPHRLKSMTAFRDFLGASSVFFFFSLLSTSLLACVLVWRWRRSYLRCCWGKRSCGF